MALFLKQETSNECDSLEGAYIEEDSSTIHIALSVVRLTNHEGQGVLKNIIVDEIIEAIR